MPYRFVLQFRGLCAFVPSHGIDKENNLISVLLVNAGQGARNNFNVRLAPHFPVIRCRLGDLQDAGNGPDEAEVMIRLDSEDLVLVPERPIRQPLTVRLGLRPEGVEAPNDEQIPDFTWVPSMDSVLPGAGDLLPGLLDERPLEARVIARFHLAEGELKTRRVGRFRGVPVVSEFRVRKPPAGARILRQAVATRVVLEMMAKGPVKLVAKRFGEETQREIRFRPAAENEERLIEVLNLCADAIQESDEARSIQKPIPDNDFGWFYLLSAAAVGRRLTSLPIPRPLPIVFQEGQNDDPGGGEPARCTKTTFNAQSEALGSFRDLVGRLRAAQ